MGTTTTTRESTTSSANPHAEFILAKLDKDLKSPTKSVRASMDGKSMLQAEFEHAREANEKEDDLESVNADGINWGMYALPLPPSASLFFLFFLFLEG